MKLRIVEDLEGCGSQRWFRLEKLVKTAAESYNGQEQWELLESGSNLPILVDKAERLKLITDRFVVIKEYEHLEDFGSLTLVDEPLKVIEPAPKLSGQPSVTYTDHPDDDIPF